MNSQHFSERFKSARVMNGFSLQDLADRLEHKVTRQSIHKYEKGDVIPDSEMLGLLCQALGVRPDYFYQTNVVQLGPIEFRKLQRFPIKEKNMTIEITRDKLSRYLELEEIIGIETPFENHIKDFQISSAEDVENAAIFLRDKWNLGTAPLYNVLELLEDKHIKVINIDTDPAFLGMQTWAGNIPVIVVNNNSAVPLDRKRFTALHELGHLLLSGIDKEPENIRERYCNRFAAAMLFHRDAVKEEIGGVRSRLFINELGALKQQYGISIQAIAYRLRDLGYITDSYLKQFLFFMNQLNIRIQEPPKYNYQGEEKSNRFDQLIFRALAENLISVSKAASLRNQKLAEFRAENML